MSKIAIAVHGGAGEETEFFKNNIRGFEEGLQHAISLGYEILNKGGSALDAVEASVMSLEDNPLFNAGKGSALNSQGEVEMDAAIMDGKTLRAGAVSIVRSVKNPIALAKVVMSKTKHVLLAGYGALELAKSKKEIQLEVDAYFITEHQYHDYLIAKNEIAPKDLLPKKFHSTVGAVALDKNRHLAAATSTGGTSYCLPGRIGDSCIIGAGCYANNKTCAISGTGEGEVLIEGVVAHTIAMLLELKNLPLQVACDYVVKERNKKGDIGVIAIDPHGEIGISFNTKMMKRAWRSSDMGTYQVRIY